MQADLAYEHWVNDPSRTMYGKRWDDKPPEAAPMLPEQRTKRRRSPIHTQYKRNEETRKRDWIFWELAMNGYEYPKIAQIFGCSRQTAWSAVKRAHEEYICTGIDYSLPEGETQVHPIPGGHYTPQIMPKINVHKLGIKAKYRGRRECGCYLERGDLTALINNRQHCMTHALEHHGLTWRMVESNPHLIQKLDLYGIGHKKAIPS